NVARLQDGHRIAMLQGYGRIDRYQRLARFTCKSLLAKPYGKAAEETENAAPMLFDVLDGRFDADLEAALFHDESRRAVLALMAYNFAFRKALSHDRIAIPTQERQGNARE